MRLGRYETLAKLGRGGMAEVFAARLSGEAGFERLVAIKRMLPHLGDDRALVARFLDEARLAALVMSPHVVQTLDVGRDERGHPFIVLELVPGVTLAHLLSDKPPPPLAVRVEIVTQAALGLAEVHEARSPDGAPLEIVHRDVSPQNILVGRDGRARLADFGIARANVPREDTRTGIVMGKFGYMSPEQLKCGPLDARSDVYAMGCVVWEALTLRRLHGGATPVDLTKRLTKSALPPRSPRDETPSPLLDVVERAIALDPKDRYANGRELAEALRAAAHDLGPRISERAVAEEVRRVAGQSLVDLEQALGKMTEGGQPTATLTFEVATVSGIVGSDWDPNAPTVSLTPAEPTVRDAPRARVLAPEAPSRRFWLLALSLAIGLAAIGIAIGWAVSAPSRDEPIVVHVPVEPVAAPRPPEVVAPAAPEATIETTPEAPVEAPSPVSRPRRNAAPDPAPPPSEARPGALLGADRFDSEQK